MRYGLVRRFLTKLIHDILPGGVGEPDRRISPDPLRLLRLRPVARTGCRAGSSGLGCDDGCAARRTRAGGKFRQGGNGQRKEAGAGGERMMRMRRSRMEPRPSRRRSLPRGRSVAVTAVKGTAARGKAPVVVASLPPLVIAQTQPSEGAGPAARHDGVFFTGDDQRSRRRGHATRRRGDRRHTVVVRRDRRPDRRRKQRSAAAGRSGQRVLSHGSQPMLSVVARFQQAPALVYRRLAPVFSAR